MWITSVQQRSIFNFNHFVSIDVRFMESDTNELYGVHAIDVNRKTHILYKGTEKECVQALEGIKTAVGSRNPVLLNAQRIGANECG